MGARDESKASLFIQKFDKALTLLNSFCDKSKSSFSENISFLLDKSLDHLKQLNDETDEESKSNEEPHLALIQSKSVKQFFQEVFKISRVPTIHPSIITFAINLLVELTSNETRFLCMYSELPDIFILIQQLKETTIIENNEFKQSILLFFLSLAKFKAGQQWLLSSGSLHFTVQSLSDRTIFTRKTAQELINCVLPKLDEIERETVLTELLEPILQAGQKLDNHQIESDKLKPYFEVLERYVEYNLMTNNEDKTATFLSTKNAEKALFNIVSCAENEKLLSQSGSLLAAIYAKNALEKEEEQSSWEAKTLALIQLILRRGLLRATLNVTSQSLFFWAQLKSANSFRAHLVHLMVVPILVDTEDVDEHFPEYKLICQFWKDSVADNPMTKSISDGLKAMLKSNVELNELTSIPLAGLHKSMNKLNKEFALKITRSGLFLLGCLKVPDAKRMLSAFTPQLAISLTKSLCSFIDVFNIKWWESYETCCLPIMFTRLVAYNSSRDIQVTCAGLEGLKFCIRQFIHPDQALLLHGSRESTFNDMANQLQQCTVSVHWEVRDSAMEVVLEMAKLAHHRYPEFQNLLLRSHLLEAALSAFNDTESYVRASAIAVIASATPVPILWEHLTAHSDVVSSCYNILQQDSEALARRAAAKALTHIIQSGHFPLELDRTILYRNMSAAALSDLDWEVKLQALEFWQVIIDESLTQQGMLDGAFPELTFSKEKQKIVRLDAEEIRKRLQRALSELGACGCLNALLQLVDDCDAPVREKSIQLLRRLRDVLAKYQSLDLNVMQGTQPITDALSEPMIEENITPTIESETRDQDQVIEEILSVNDSALVAGILNKNDPKMKPDPKPVSSVSTQNFVNRINMMELETMLESTWMSSDLHVIDFDSLLDDLQDCIHTDTSRPRPDCY